MINLRTLTKAGEKCVNIIMRPSSIPALLFFMVIATHSYFSGATLWNQNARIDAIFSFVEPGPNQYTFKIDSLMANQSRGLVTGDWARGIDQHYYSNKAPGTQILGTPVYFVIYGLENLLGYDPTSPEVTQINRYLLNIWCSVIWTALATLIFYSFLLASGMTLESAILLPFVYAFATLTFPFDTSIWGHTTAANFLLISTCLVFWNAEARKIKLAGFLAGSAILIEYTALIPALFIILSLLIQRHFENRSVNREKHEIKKFVLGFTPPLLILLLYQKLCFGGFFTNAVAQSNPQFVDASRVGGFFSNISFPVMYQLLIPPYRGLFAYCPVLIFALPGAVMAWRSGKKTLVGISVFSILTMLMLLASFNGWWAGWSSGPRYLILTLPYWCLLLPEVKNLCAPIRFAYFASLGVSVFNMIAISAVDVMAPEQVTNPLYENIYTLFLSANYPRHENSYNLGSTVFHLLPGWDLIPFAVLFFAGIGLLFRISSQTSKARALHLANVQTKANINDTTTFDCRFTELPMAQWCRSRASPFINYLNKLKSLNLKKAGAALGILYSLFFIALRFYRSDLMPFILDEPNLQNLVDWHVKTGVFPSMSISGSVGLNYGPTAIWFYWLIRQFTDNIQIVSAVHALTYVASFLLLSALIWRQFRNFSFIICLLLASTSPLLFYYSRVVWDNTLLIPLSILLISTSLKLGSWVSPLTLRFSLFCLVWGCVAGFLFSLHLMSIALILVSAIFVLILQRRRKFVLVFAFVAALGFLIVTAPYLPHLFHSFSQVKHVGALGQFLWKQSFLNLFSMVSSSVMTYFYAPFFNEFSNHNFDASFILIFVVGSIFVFKKTRAIKIPLVLKFTGAVALTTLLLDFAMQVDPSHPHYTNPFWLFPFILVASAWSLADESQKKILFFAVLLTVGNNSIQIIETFQKISRDHGTREAHYGPTLKEQMDLVEMACQHTKAEGNTNLGLDISLTSALFPPSLLYHFNHTPSCKGLQLSIDSRGKKVRYVNGSQTSTRLMISNATP